MRLINEYKIKIIPMVKTIAALATFLLPLERILNGSIGNDSCTVINHLWIDFFKLTNILNQALLRNHNISH